MISPSAEWIATAIWFLRRKAGQPTCGHGQRSSRISASVGDLGVPYCIVLVSVALFYGWNQLSLQEMSAPAGPFPDRKATNAALQVHAHATGRIYQQHKNASGKEKLVLRCVNSSEISEQKLKEAAAYKQKQAERKVKNVALPGNNSSTEAVAPACDLDELVRLIDEDEDEHANAVAGSSDMDAGATFSAAPDADAAGLLAEGQVVLTDSSFAMDTDVPDAYAINAGVPGAYATDADGTASLAYVLPLESCPGSLVYTNAKKKAGWCLKSETGHSVNCTNLRYRVTRHVVAALLGSTIDSRPTESKSLTRKDQLALCQSHGMSSTSVSTCARAFGQPKKMVAETYEETIGMVVPFLRELAKDNPGTCCALKTILNGQARVRVFQSVDQEESQEWSPGVFDPFSSDDQK